MTNTVQTTMLRIFYPERYGGPEVEAVARADAAHLFGVLEARLEGREWLVGDHRTGADLFLFMLTRWGAAAGHRPPGSCRACAPTSCERSRSPGVRRMFEEEGLDFPDGRAERSRRPTPWWASSASPSAPGGSCRLSAGTDANSAPLRSLTCAVAPGVME